jgi:hypothetical protein
MTKASKDHAAKKGRAPPQAVRRQEIDSKVGGSRELETNENIVTVHFHFKFFEGDITIIPIDPGLDVEFPSMPGTGDYFSITLPFTDRSALMRAHIVDRVECAIDIEERDALPLDLDAFALACRNVADLGHFDKIGHAILLSPK